MISDPGCERPVLGIGDAGVPPERSEIQHPVSCQDKNARLSEQNGIHVLVNTYFVFRTAPQGENSEYCVKMSFFQRNFHNITKKKQL